MKDMLDELLTLREGNALFVDKVLLFREGTALCAGVVLSLVEKIGGRLSVC